MTDASLPDGVQAARKFYERPWVYVAGPYTRPDPVRNTHDAVKWGKRINDSGLGTAFVPHLSMLWHIVAPEDNIEYWYEYDLAALARSDACFRFSGASTGADREVVFARSRGIPVFTDFVELLDWLAAADACEAERVPAPTLNHRGSVADVCRENGWGPGTRIIGDEGYGPTVIEITAVGEDGLFAKRLGHAGVASRPYESRWVLYCREWRRATDDEVPAPLAPGERARIVGRDLYGVVIDGPDSGGSYRIDCGTHGVWLAAAVHREAKT